MLNLFMLLLVCLYNIGVGVVIYKIAEFIGNKINFYKLWCSIYYAIRNQFSQREK